MIVVDDDIEKFMMDMVCVEWVELVVFLIIFIL